jgi:CDP-diacylglycerol pyrophosphatase
MGPMRAAMLPVADGQITRFSYLHLGDVWMFAQAGFNMTVAQLAVVLMVASYNGWRQQRLHRHITCSEFLCDSLWGPRK